MKERNKPYVALNVAVSADGKISTGGRESFALGSGMDRKFMSVLRAKADAVVIGAGTLRVDGFPLVVRDRRLVKERIASGKTPHPLNVLLSNDLDLPRGKKFFHHPETEKIVFTTRTAPRDAVEFLARHAKIVVQPRKRVSARLVVSRLAQMGVANILLEGGGELNFSFVQAGLVDEIYITITPRLVGGSGAPTMLDGKGFSRDSLRRLRLEYAERFGDELFLKYRVIDKGKR
jgi:2,5-diamino-6-(ribosylamino)-4(3H)-pyrimidinone 5'-phosphate reductase